LDKVQLDNIVRQIKTVKKSSKTVSKGVIEISKEMKTINIGAKDWKKTLKFTTEQEGIVYILKDSKGAILKIGKTTRHNIDGRFSKYLTYANKTGKNLSADIFTIEKNNIRSIESVESEIRKAWGADKVLPWDNSKRRLGRKGSGLPKL
jgi:T5orf172 domain